MSVDIEGDYEEFYFAVYRRDLTDENMFTDDMFYEDLNTGYSIKSMIISVPMDTEMTVIAVAYDTMFMPCKLFRKLIYLTKEGASAPEAFAAYGGEPSTAALARSLVIPEVSIGDIRIEREQHIEVEVSALDRENILLKRKEELKAKVERFAKDSNYSQRIAINK